MKNGRHFLAAGSVLAGATAFLGGWLWRAESDTQTNILSEFPRLTASRGVPQQVDESRYFYVVTELLRLNYVDVVKVDENMSNGAVRGMVNYLLDPESLYYDEKEFSAFLASRKGVYEGIGVEVSYSFDMAELEKLRDGTRGANAYLALPGIKVRAVMPGSAAERAGLLPGDKVLAVNGKWVLSGEDLLALRKLQTAVTEGKAKPETLEALRLKLDTRVKKSMSAGKARDHLLTGDQGKVHVVWEHAGKEKEASIEIGKTEVSPAIETADGIVFRLFDGAARHIPKTGVVRLDLRNSGAGCSTEVFPTLERLVAPGTYGVIVKDPNKVVATLLVRGNPSPPQVTVTVDETTTGAAAVLALALSKAKNVTVSGTLPISAQWVEVVPLPLGEGYTLATGQYAATEGKVVMKR